MLCIWLIWPFKTTQLQETAAEIVFLRLTKHDNTVSYKKTNNWSLSSIFCIAEFNRNLFTTAPLNVNWHQFAFLKFVTKYFLHKTHSISHKHTFRAGSYTSWFYLFNWQGQYAVQYIAADRRSLPSTVPGLVVTHNMKLYKTLKLHYTVCTSNWIEDVSGREVLCFILIR